MILLNLACGLDLDEIQNPWHVLRQLAATSKRNFADIDKSGELLEVANPSEEETFGAEVVVLPSLSECLGGSGDHSEPFRAPAFKCTCPRLSVDQQRSRYCSQVYGRRAADNSSAGPNHNSHRATHREEGEFLPLSADWRAGHSISWPSKEEQIVEFGPVNRNSVARRLARGSLRRLSQARGYCNNTGGEPTDLDKETSAGKMFLTDVASLVLYKIEELLLEANSNLADILLAESRHSSLVLGRILGSFQLASQSSLAQLEANELAALNGGHQITKAPPVVMIRAPLSNASVSTRLRLGPRRGEATYRTLLARPNRRNHLRRCGCDSGIDLDCDETEMAEGDAEETRLVEIGSSAPRPRGRDEPGLLALEELVKFRADPKVQSIVEQSLNLFGELIRESPLFRLIKNGNNLFNSHELKLYACIECQRLRSSVRFKWITLCLEIAFGELETGGVTTLPGKLLPELPSRREQKQRALGKDNKLATEATAELTLPPIEAHKREDLAQLRYFDSLALLMANLLRQHFLVPALERWCSLLEAHSPDRDARCFGPTSGFPGASSGIGDDEALGRASHCNEPKLSLHVSLIELDNQVQLANSSEHLDSCFEAQPTTFLAPSKPENELKETLGFVVDELANICRRLPRIESQLESQRQHLETSEDSSESERGEFILTLEANDNLLLESKSRLSHLIDRLNLPLACHASDQGGGQVRNKTTPSSPDGRKGAGASFNDQLGSGGLGVSAESSEISEDLGRQPEVGAVCGARQHGTKWVDPDYLRIVELVNNFRRGANMDSVARRHVGCFGDGGNGSGAAGADELSANESAKSAAAAETAGDDRLQRLQTCCHQIRLLDSLEEQLTCRLSRHHDHGFVMLDYGPLRDSLLKCIRKERLLVVRLNLDEQLRLMDRLRLQFEEIELSVDLESAIEDYLADRRQLRQSQHQQVLVEDADYLAQEPLGANDTPDCGGDLQIPKSSRQEGQVDQEDVSPDATVDSGDRRAEDEFVEAITQGRANGPLGAAGNLATDELGGDEMAASERQVVPIVECQLLVASYEFMSNLLTNELGLLARDVRVAFEGLVFLSEFVSHDQLDPTHWQLITEMTVRSREFRPMMSHAKARLKLARARLSHSNELRSQVLSRLALEFHQLIGELAIRLLASNEDGQQQQLELERDNLNGCMKWDDITDGASFGGRRIVQLDTIQETAAWASELELRYLFIERQNLLLAREADLLQTRARLMVGPENCSPTMDSNDIDDIREDDELWGPLASASQARGSILERWRPLVGLAANLWRLIEDYETQQVRWLNSDTKRIDFLKMDSTFQMFKQQLDRLQRQYQRYSDKLSGNLGECCILSLRHNFRELETRFDQFAKKRLPLFRFLTNKHLTDDHWARVNKLLDRAANGGERGSGVNPLERLLLSGATVLAPQACTTLAQFLELNAEKHVERLDEINKEAIIEQELTNFLIAEVGSLNDDNSKHLTSERRAQLKALDLSGAWFEGWTDKQLVLAASRFIEAKLKFPMDGLANSVKLDEPIGCSELPAELATKLVACHSMVKRHLRLSYSIGLDGATSWQLPHSQTRNNSKLGDAAEHRHQPTGRLLTLRSCKQLTSAELATPALFVEFLRLFTVSWLSGRAKLAKLLGRLKCDLETMDEHLVDIQVLVDQVNEIRGADLRQVGLEGEATIVDLERKSVGLEIEREILSTMESLALERQREALNQRDKCIRQITERAIPAIRAATKALDCLDARSLKTLRCVRPNPPEVVRLVLEAVCLLRSCAATSGSGKPMEPERRFDSLSGRILEDYWPPACRMLNGVHSSKFLADLRRVDRRRMPSEVMRLIRRRYLSSSSFQPATIGRVSPECGLLARWLVAVDVFDRVINVVRPNYGVYLESERQLAGLLAEVNDRRRQIEAIGLELQRMEEALEARIGLKMSLADSLEQCSDQLKRVELTRTELICRRQACSAQLERLRRQQSRLANRCLMRAAGLVYLDAMRADERRQMALLLRKLVAADASSASGQPGVCPLFVARPNGL